MLLYLQGIMRDLSKNPSPAIPNASPEPKEGVSDLDITVQGDQISEHPCISLGFIAVTCISFMELYNPTIISHLIWSSPSFTRLCSRTTLPKLPSPSRSLWQPMVMTHNERRCAIGTKASSEEEMAGWTGELILLGPSRLCNVI